MRELRRLAWVAAVAAVTAAPAPGQPTGGTVGGGGTTGGGTTGGGGGAGGGAGSLSNQFQLITPEAPPQITGVSAYTSTTGAASAVDASNFLRATYANPYYQGRPGAQVNQAPGGFGVPLFGTTGGGGGGLAGGGAAGGARAGMTTGTGLGSGRAGGTTGGTGAVAASVGGTTGGATGGRAGAGGLAGGGMAGGGLGGGLAGGGLGGGLAGGGLAGGALGGGLAGGRAGALGGALGGGRAGALGGGLTTQTAQIVALPQQIAYPAVLRFPPPPVVPTRVHADISGTIARSGMIANPAGVQVQVTGNQVVLRGAVRDEDEARLVENVVRLTPGVREVKNELAYPRP